MKAPLATAIAVILSLDGVAHAAENRRLEQIVVTGTRSEQPRFANPAALSVVTREEIEKSGAMTVADVLRARAGIQIRDAIGDGGRGVVVSMRGFGENAPNNTLVLVDGRRLNNPTLAGPDLNSVAIKDIERIEIIQGGGGVLYGDQAVGGVINIITRAPEQGSVALATSGGSHGHRQASLVASERFGSGIAARLSAERRESDNYRANNESEYTNLLGLLEYGGSRGRVFAELQRVDDNLEFPGALTEDEARADRRQSTHIGDFGDLQTTSLRLGGRYVINANWSAELELTDRDNDGDGYQFASNTTAMRVQSANPRLIGNFPTAAGNSVLTIGFDATDSKYRLDIPDYFFTTDFRQEQRDPYIQLVHPLTTALSASIGVRRASVDDENRSTGKSQSADETITTASIGWQFRDGMRAILRHDEVMRFANVDENGFTRTDVEFLRPQTGSSWEGGVEWYGEQGSGRVLAFQLDLDDEILYFPFDQQGPGAAFGFPGANVNMDATRRRGLLLEWQWQATAALNLGGSYTLTDAEITDGGLEGRDVPYVARHNGALTATWTFARGFDAFAELVHTGERRALGDEMNVHGKVDAESVLNAALRWTGGAWHASLRLNNLLGEHYDTLTVDQNLEPANPAGAYLRNVYPAPGRTAYLTVGYDL